MDGCDSVTLRRLAPLRWSRIMQACWAWIGRCAKGRVLKSARRLM